MKTFFALVLSSLLFSNTFGQNNPMEFLNAVPQPPYNPCGMSVEQKMQFFDKIAGFDTIYSAKMAEYQQGDDKFQEEHQDEETVNALMKAGYSRQDAEKMKNLDNMSEQEKTAMANQVMLNQYNMTLVEAQKVADYDTASQHRWAKAQSTMMMADAQADPEKNTKSNSKLKATSKYSRK